MDDDSFDIENYVHLVVGPMLDYPDGSRIKVSRSEGGSVTTIELSVHGSDYGKVIGKTGRTYDALVTILRAVEWNNKRQRTRYVLRVDSTEAG